jgi:hypothetical protein
MWHMWTNCNPPHSSLVKKNKCFTKYNFSPFKIHTMEKLKNAFISALLKALFSMGGN